MRAENNENNAMKFFFNNAVKLIFTYILKASLIKKTSRRLQSRKFPFVVWSRKNVTFVFFLFFLVIKRIYLAKNWGGEARSPSPSVTTISTNEIFSFFFRTVRISKYWKAWPTWYFNIYRVCHKKATQNKSKYFK